MALLQYDIDAPSSAVVAAVGVVQNVVFPSASNKHIIQFTSLSTRFLVPTVLSTPHQDSAARKHVGIYDSGTSSGAKIFSRYPQSL